MKRVFNLLSILVFIPFAAYAQYGGVSGTVKDKASELPLVGVKIKFQETGQEITTDASGKFSISNLEKDSMELLVEHPDYAPYQKKVSSGEYLTIYLTKKNTDNEDQHKAVVIELSDTDLNEGDENLQSNVSGVLRSGRDVFTNTAGFVWGPLRFRMRGYENKYTSLHMNGIQTNDLESGRAIWAYWGGLNDVTRNAVSGKGITENESAFGEVGGYTSVNTRASHQPLGTKLTYSFTNRSYRHRAMITHTTGMLPNGWAFSLSASLRNAKVNSIFKDAPTEGVSYDAYAYFLAAEKMFNAKHSLGLVVFGAPSLRGGRSATTQEVYDLTNTRYNPNWGMQNGKKRNARMTDSHTPFAILSHYWKINNTSKLQTNLAYSHGKYNKTSLNWFNAADPRPDYYRFLPSYFEDETAKEIRKQEFKDGERQLDWDAMYQANYTSYEEIKDANGIKGNTISGRQSQYIVENRRNENNQLWASSTLKTNLSETILLNAGVQYRYLKARHYKTLEDLMGGDFILDFDKYAERDLAGEGVSDNDIRHPNHVITKTGDVFGNDYYSNIHQANLHVQSQLQRERFEAYAAVNASFTKFWRTGNMQNGKFPNRSLGDSEKKSFINYGAKVGGTYKLSGMHFLHAAATYMTKAPDFRNSFISPRTRNQVVTDLKSENILSGQVGYVLQASKIKATVDLFYTQFKNQTHIYNFYFDGYRNFVNFVLSDINKTHQGVEFGVEYLPFPGLTIHGVGSLGYYYWSSRPSFSVYVDNNSEVKYENETAYVENFRVSGTPQTAFSGGVKYFAPGYWWIGVNANYLANRYLAFSALTRTEDAVKFIDHNSEEFQKLTRQKDLPNSFTMDVFVGKSFRINYKHYISLSLNISNVLNKKDIITGGYEQSRIDASTENLEKFPPKYYYFPGIQYYFNINYRF